MEKLLNKTWQALLALALLLSQPLQAAPRSAELADFLAGFKTFQADFEQSTFDQNGRLSQQMRGFVVIQRPGRFRWDYQSPYEQEIIADGHKVWFYDIDLEQVTVKLQARTLGNTPGELLSRGGALADKFTIEPAASRDGLNWYNLKPKASDTSFERLSLAMSGGVLVRMELLDSFGQLTELRFDNVRVDQPVDGALFQFTAPAGIDVIDETVQ